MCRREETSPGPLSFRCRFCLSMSYWLGVRDRRIAGYLTSAEWRDDRTAARSPDQRWSSLVLFILIVGNPHEPSALWGLAGLRWHYLHGGWLHSHRPFPRHPVFSGRCWSGLAFFATSVLETPSNIVRWAVHPSGMVHTRCQRYIHRAPVNISYLQYNNDKSSGYSIYVAIQINKWYSFTLGAGRPNLKACIQ